MAEEIVIPASEIVQLSAAKPRKAHVRILFENGEPVALIRATSEAQAIRFHTKKIYEAPVADQDHLIKYAGKFIVQDATAETD
jgi:hypothetical protein